MRPPLALSISASDPIGASGIQADLKTFTALGAYGASVVTMVSSASTQGIVDVYRLPVETVASQLDAVLDDVRPDATKIGVLGTESTVAQVARTVRDRRAEMGRIVLDAVMVDVDGTPLLTAEGARALTSELLPIAHVVTANVLEAAQLLGREQATDIEQMREHALAVQALGPAAVIVTGGRVAGEDSVDVLVHPGGTDVLRSPRVGTRHIRGAGATLSAAIAAQYARVAEFDRAGEQGEIGDEGTQDDDATIVASAREFLASTIENAAHWEISRTPQSGHGPVNHLITLDRP